MQNPDCGIIFMDSKSDTTDKIYSMAKYYNRDVVYINPVLENNIYFNPLIRDEATIIENIALSILMVSPDPSQYFKDMNELLLRNSLKVLKRLMGDKATFIDLERLIQNSGGEGKKMVIQFAKMKSTNKDIVKENQNLANWFLCDYFSEKSKIYEHCSGLRAIISKLINNKYLRRILNPPKKTECINFNNYLEENKVIIITNNQGTMLDSGKLFGQL